MSRFEDVLGCRLASPGNPPAGFEKGCREFVGARTPRGYGVIRYNRKTWGAHRLAWFLTNGPIPEGQEVQHLCNNPPCCELSHLELGNHARNMRYMKECGRAATQDSHGSHTCPESLKKRALGKNNGRHTKPEAFSNPACGSRHGVAKLDEDAVKRIREVYANGETTQTELAVIYGVTQGMIWRIVRGKNWKHIL